MDVRESIVNVLSGHPTPYIVAGATVNPLNSFITLDNGNQTGKEYTCLLFSLTPLNADAIVAKMSRTNGTFTQRLYQVLSEKLLPLDNVQYQPGAAITFDGQLKKGEILPVMLEMSMVN